MSGRKIAAIGLLFISLFHAFIIAIEADVHHPTPRNQLKRRKRSTPLRPSSGQPPPGNSLVTRGDWEQIAYVNAHNVLRQKIGVPPLQWDKGLASIARAWAIQRTDDCNYRIHSTNKYGENIFWMQYKEFNPTYVVNKWFSEQQLFDHMTNLCKCRPETDACECGHYLNVIWKTAQRVGCSGAVQCNQGKGVLVVCEYDPIGNIKGLNPLNPLPKGLNPLNALPKGLNPLNALPKGLNPLNPLPILGLAKGVTPSRGRQHEKLG